MAKKKEKEEGSKKDDGKTKEKGAKQKLTEKMLDDAKNAITVIVEGQSIIGTKKDYSSGSTGWNITGKVNVDGLVCQMTGNLVIVGSKDFRRKNK